MQVVAAVSISVTGLHYIGSREFPCVPCGSLYSEVTDGLVVNHSAVLDDKQSHSSDSVLVDVSADAVDLIVLERQEVVASEFLLDPHLSVASSSTADAQTSHVATPSESVAALEGSLPSEETIELVGDARVFQEGLELLNAELGDEVEKLLPFTSIASVLSTPTG